MYKYDYLVVGAGLFGSIFAHEATKCGKKVLVIDKRNHVAGNIYTYAESNINIHKYGAHIFHTSDRKIWEYINSFAAFNNFINSPIANYKGEIYNLPFNMNTFNKLWGVVTPEEAFMEIEKQKKKSGIINPSNLEEQAIHLVGFDIYDKLIKGYTEKQWGKSCKDLPAFIINRIPVRYRYDNNYFNDTYQGIPIGGYTQIVDKMLQGCEIQLACDYNEDKNKLNSIAERVIYTGALDEFYAYRFGPLEYRSLHFENKYIPNIDYQGNAVVNYTDIDTPFTRIIEHKFFEYLNQKDTIITKEFPVLWSLGKEPYYPVNDAKNQNLFDKYQQLAVTEEKTIFGGRLAEYKYYDMDKIVLSALAVSSKELS